MNSTGNAAFCAQTNDLFAQLGEIGAFMQRQRRFRDIVSACSRLVQVSAKPGEG